MGAGIARAGAQIAGSEVRAEVAILLDYATRFAFQIQANNPAFRYAAHVQHIFQAFHTRNVPVDIVSQRDDLMRYKLLVVPACYVLDEATAAAITRFVEQGGVLLVTPRTGVKDETNTVVNMPLPGLLAAVCGVEVEEYDSLPEGVSQPLAIKPEIYQGAAPHASIWCDVLRLVSAEAVAHYTGDYYAGSPAITLNRFGKGQAVYVATFGDAALYAALGDWLLALAQVQTMAVAPAGVECCVRWQGERRLLFVLNHTAEEQNFSLSAPMVDILSGQVIDAPAVVLKPRQVLILTE